MASTRSLFLAARLLGSTGLLGGLFLSARLLGRLLPAAAFLLCPAGLFVHRGPSATLGFFRRDALFLVSLFDVLGLAFLLVRVARLVASWHESAPRLKT